MRGGRIAGLVAAFGLAATLPGPAMADVLTEEQARRAELELRTFTCPLDGKAFRQTVQFPHFPLVTLPDGSHLGDQWVEMELPECPGNGLLILPDYGAGEAEDGGLTYYTYTEQDLARLPALLASPQWQALAGQTRQLRAYWLATELGRPALDRFSLLLAAPWGAGASAERRRTAQEWLVRDMPGLIDELASDPERGGSARLYVINALRELGRFDEALAMLDAAPPGVAMPEDPDAMFGPGEYDGPMRAVIEARDDDRYPIGLLTNNFAGRLCNGGPEYEDMRGPNAGRACAARQARMDADEEVFQQSLKLSEDDAKLDGACAATPAGSREAALERACDHRRFELATAEADRLVEQEPAAVVAACSARTPGRPITGMDFACIHYRTSLGGVVERILIRDDAAYAALCEPQPWPYEDDEEAYLACSGADKKRAELGALQLWKDLPALRHYCDSTELEGRTHAQITACVWLEFHDEDDPPTDYVTEEATGPLFYDELSRLAVPHAQELVAALMRKGGVRP